MSAISIQ